MHTYTNRHKYLSLSDKFMRPQRSAVEEAIVILYIAVILGRKTIDELQTFEENDFGYASKGISKSLKNLVVLFD